MRKKQNKAERREGVRTDHKEQNVYVVNIIKHNMGSERNRTKQKYWWGIEVLPFFTARFYTTTLQGLQVHPACHHFDLATQQSAIKLDAM